LPDLNSILLFACQTANLLVYSYLQFGTAGN
jgi:hypothetical protein